MFAAVEELADSISNCWSIRREWRFGGLAVWRGSLSEGMGGWQAIHHMIVKCCTVVTTVVCAQLLVGNVLQYSIFDVYTTVAKGHHKVVQVPTLGGWYARKEVPHCVEQNRTRQGDSFRWRGIDMTGRIFMNIPTISKRINRWNEEGPSFMSKEKNRRQDIVTLTVGLNRVENRLTWQGGDAFFITCRVNTTVK